MDDSSTASELDMLYNMANRQRKYIQDLDSALIRIKNKTYGICTVTGELIDKKRLLAVPTTTKSMNAKLSESKPSGGGAPASKQAVPDEDNDGEEKPKETAPRTPKVITKVIRKPSPGQASKPKPADDDDLDDAETMTQQELIDGLIEDAVERGLDEEHAEKVVRSVLNMVTAAARS